MNKTYYVSLIYDASEPLTVHAENVEEAVDKAHEKARAGLCHQCSDNLELGDVIKEIVCDEDGNELELGFDTGTVGGFKLEKRGAEVWAVRGLSSIYVGEAQ